MAWGFFDSPKGTRGPFGDLSEGPSGRACTIAMREGWVASRKSWASLLWCDPWLSWPLTAVVSPARVFLRNRELPADRCLARVRAFFSAPVVVFHMNILSYFAFLCLFAYVLMVDFQPQPSSCECLIYVWLFSLACEELRQVGQPAPTPPADPPTPRSILGSVTFSRWPLTPCHAQ